MEITVVAIASTLGLVFNLLLFIDSVRDRWLVQHAIPSREDLSDVSLDQEIEAGFWLVIQLFFFIISLIVIFNDGEVLRGVAFLLLISIPIVIAARSVYAWTRRKRAFRVVLKQTEGEED